MQFTYLYYLTQFMAGGVGNAYAGIWFKSQGLTETQIGLLSSVPITIMLLSNILVGRIADRAKDWRQVIILGCVLSGLSAIGLFFVASFWQLLVINSMAVLFHWAIIPVSDAAALNLSKKHGGQRMLGRMRGLGSMGYMLLLLVTGFAINHFGAWIFLPLWVGMMLLRGAATFTLPAFKADLKVDDHDHSFRRFFAPWLFLPLVGWSIVYGTMFVLNSFQSLLWSEQGFANTTISILIAVGALSEVIVFFLAGRLPRSLDARWFILISGITTVLRWAAMSFNPPIPVLVGLQALHGITFALGFVACASYINRSVPVAVAAEAQSFFVVLQLIASIAIVSIFSQFAHDASLAFTANSVLALIGAALCATALHFKPPARPS